LNNLKLSISRTLLRRTGYCLAAVGTAVVFFAVGILFRVLVGPVSLGPLSGELRSALRQQLPGLQLRFDEAALEWSRDEGRVNLVIFGTRVFDRNDRIIAQAPEAEIGLAAVPFLMGKLVIKRIALVGVQLTLVHTKDGAIRLGTDRDRSQTDILKEIRDAIARSGPGNTSLQTFAVHRARLAFFDEQTGAFVVAPEAELQIANGQGPRSIAPLIAAVDAQLEVSGRPSRFLASFEFPHNGDTLTADFSVSKLNLRSLAANSKTFAFLEPFDLTADVTGSFAVLNGNTIKSADIGIGASGTIVGLGKPLHLKSVRLLARYDGATGRVLIDDGAIEGEHVHAHITGSSTIDIGPGGTLSAAKFSIGVDRLAENMPGLFPQSVSLARALFRGSYIPADRELMIDEAYISGGPFSASLSGRVALSPNLSPAIAVDGKINQIAVRDLLRYWPFGVGPGARDWIDRNVSAGRIGPIMIHTNLAAGAMDAPALPEDALNISFPIGGATITYLHGLTPLQNAAGTAQLSGDTFKGEVASASVGPLAVTNGHVTIPNLHMHGMIGHMTAHVQGAVPNVLALADMKPLQYPSRFHIVPASTAGAAALDFDFHLPMTRTLTVDQVALSIRAGVTGLSIALGPHTKVTNGSANFDIDNSSLHATGQLSFGATSLAVDWHEQFRPAAVTTRVHVHGTLDDATRAAFNLHTEHILSGPVAMDADLLGARGSIRHAQISADLTPTNLSVDLVNIKKPAGAPASATIAANFDTGGNFRTADVVLSGGTLSARGSATFSDAGDLQRLDLASVRDGGLNDFALSMNDAPQTGLNLVINGHSADGTALGRKSPGSSATAKSGANESAEPFHVSARLDRLVLREGMSLSPFALDVSGVGNRPRTMALSANLSKSAQVTANITSSDSGRKVVLASNDAGLFLKGLFGFTSVKSGQLEMNAAMPPMNAIPRKGGPDFSGEVVIHNCTVVNQALLTRLFSSGSLTGFVDLMRGQGIAIDTLDVPFQVSGNVIDIHDARASGPSIGITTDGYVDRTNDQIALQGAIAPLYGLNGVLGSIPVLGNVFVSKKGEGIFGVTYRATGNADEPQITVNPLAILAPGIFRRIFEGTAPSGPPAQANSVTPTPRPQ
jgi:hypothetical protein